MRCIKCCELLIKCKCFQYQGQHRCDICNRKFEFGEQFYSDSPMSFVHSRCRFSKDKT